MDGSRFDTLTRSLAAMSSRRALVVLIAALGLVVPGAQNRAEAVTIKCNRRCDECERCKKVRCTKTKSGKKRCTGRCKPQPNGKPCGEFAVCQNRQCTALSRPVGAPCREDTDCASGFCGCVEGRCTCRQPPVVV